MRSLCVATSAALPSPRTSAEELGEDGVGGRLVEIAGGLVGEHQRRLVGERTGDRDTLLLAAGQLRRAVVEPRAKPERGQQLLPPGRARPPVGARGSSCGRMTFSRALKSGSRWWNW